MLSEGPAATIAPRRARPALLLLCALYLLIFGRYLIGFAPAGGDIVNQYLPYQQLVREAIRGGDAPLWNAMTFCGRPLMADIQVGVLYPPNWLHWLLPLPLGFGLLLALHWGWMLWGCWKLGGHWRLAPEATALGALLFALSPFFTLKLSSGIILFLYVGSWWPWLALGVSRLVERPSFARMAQLTLVLALSLLAGSPQITFYGWIMAAAFALGLGIAGAGGGGGSRRRRAAAVARGLGWFALAVALALGLTALQTAQTFHFIRQSFERGAGGAGWDYVTDGSLSPGILWLLLNPGYLGIGHSELALYFGSRLDFSEACFYSPLWVSLLLIPAGAPCILRLIRTESIEIHRRRRLAALAMLAVVAVLFGLALALGEFSPLFAAFYRFVPGFDRFRVPARLMLFVVGGQALAAALALDAMLRVGSPAAIRRRLAGGAAVALALVWLSFALRDQVWASFPESPVALGLGQPGVDEAYAAETRHAGWMGLRVSVALAAALALLWRVAGRRDAASAPRRLGPALGLPALAALELALLALPYLKDVYFTRYEATFYPQTPLVQKLTELDQGGRILWLDNVHAWMFDQNQPEVFPNRLLMYGLDEARGYDPVNARWIGVWSNLLAGFPPEQNPRGFMLIPVIARPAWLTLMGVDTILTYGAGAAIDLSGTPGLELADRLEFPEGDLELWRNTWFRGMAFAAPMPRLVNQRDEEDWITPLVHSAGLATPAADRATTATAAIDPMATIVTTPGVLWLGERLTPEIEASYRVEPLDDPAEAAPNRFGYRVDFPRPALLCLAQSAWPGWGVRLDGAPAPVQRLSGVFLVTAVPAGSHEVIFEFLPPGLLPGRWISILAAVILAYGLIRSRLKGSRPHGQP